MGYLDSTGLAHLWEKVKSALSGKQDRLSGAAGQVVGFGEDGGAAALDAVPIASGGTGARTEQEALSNLLSPLALKSTGSYYSGLRLPYYYSYEGKEEEAGAYYIPFTTVQAWTINRSTAVQQANTSYATYMARGIALLAAAPATLANGTAAFVYE